MTLTSPAASPASGPLLGGTEAPLLEISDLAVRFETPEGEIQAVNGISLEVMPNEVFAIVGESGSGKSVSMLSVMGLLASPPARVSGSIRFAGEELLGVNRPRLNEIRGGEIGMVFQDPMSSLNPVHRVGKQIAEAIRLHRSVSRSESRERAIRLLDRVGQTNHYKCRIIFSADSHERST